MDQFWKLLTLIVIVAFAALLVGHAQQTGTVVQAGLGGINTLLNTVENPGTASTSSSLTNLSSTLNNLGSNENSIVPDLFGENGFIN